MSPTPPLSLGTPISDWRVLPAPLQPAHLLDKPREVLGKKMLLFLSDGQLNNCLFHHTILVKLGLYKEFCPPEPLWRFPVKLQHFVAPHLSFTNSCFYNYIYPPANGFTANDISFWWESFWAEAKLLQAKQILFSYSLISRKLRGQYCAATDMEASSCLCSSEFFLSCTPQDTTRSQKPHCLI